MSLHVRRQIREAFVAALTGLPTTGANAFAAYPFRLQESSLPAVVVVTLEETVLGTGDLDVEDLERSLTVVVVGHALGLAVENTLDAIALEVEAAVAAASDGPDGLGALVRFAQPARTQMAVDGDGDKRAGEIRLSFTVQYSASRADPSRLGR